MDKLLSSLRRAWSQPGFVVVAMIMLLAAGGLNAATKYLQLHFRKLPVPLAHPLGEVPARLGPWIQVSMDQLLPGDIQDALGTDKYVFRDYIDTRLVPEKELAAFKDKTPDECKRLTNAIQLRNPAAVVNAGLTYYTGLADTVAHIPDRCYIADGYQPTRYTYPSWSALKGRAGEDKVRFIDFEDPTSSTSSVKRNVAYFFNCNGEYMQDPIKVRTTLANLFQQYGYYMKVEIQTLNLSPEESAKVMNDFLTQVLPQAEKSLPDWEKYRTAR